MTRRDPTDHPCAWTPVENDSPAASEGSSRRWNRRRFLAAFGAGAVTSSAGCSEVTAARFSAEPVLLDEAARTALGVAEERREPLVEEVERMGLRAEVTSELAVYSLNAERGEVRFGDGQHGSRPSTGGDNVNPAYRTGGGTQGNLDAGVDDRTALGTPLHLGVLSTPSASVLGEELNPLATTGLEALVSGTYGDRFIREIGVPTDRVVRPFEAISPSDIVGAVTPSNIVGAITPSDLVGAVTPSNIVGAITPSDLHAFAGVVADANGRPSLVFGNLVRTSRGESGDDVVLGAGISRRAVRGADPDLLESRPLLGPDGWITPGGFATNLVQTGALARHLESTTDGWRPFGGADPPEVSLAPGELVSDAVDATPDLAVVLAPMDVPIDDWVVFGEETVADHNPDRDPTDPVVIVAFVHLLEARWPEWRETDPTGLLDGVVDRGVKFHAFPRSRLARHLVSAMRTG